MAQSIVDVVSEKVRLQAEAIESLNMLARIVNPAGDAQTFYDYYVFQMRFLDELNALQESLRVLLHERLFPLVADVKSIHLQVTK